MTKLFVALDLPDAITAELVLVQPPPTSGVRLVKRRQMHLTLHFVGAARIERLAEALKAVTFPAFALAVEGVGMFPSAGGAVTLWAGVAASAELLRLHEAIATALAPTGFRPEARPYHPHITLARCERGVPADRIDDFLGRQIAFALPPCRATSFGLFSSSSVNGAPVYRCERSFPLLVADGS